jgi:hypothetical protein
VTSANPKSAHPRTILASICRLPYSTRSIESNSFSFAGLDAKRGEEDSEIESHRGKNLWRQMLSIMAGGNAEHLKQRVLPPGKLKRFLRVQCVQGGPKGPGNLRMRRDQHRLADLLFDEVRQEGIVLYDSPGEDHRVGESVHLEYSFNDRVE